MIIKGYKIFNSDWTCRNKQYSCPGEFVENVYPRVCKRGMHFCPRIMDCLVYYPLELETSDGELAKLRVAAVNADADDCDMPIDWGESLYGEKYATSRLNVVEELNDEEILTELIKEMGAATSQELYEMIDAIKIHMACPINPNSLTQHIIMCAARIYESKRISDLGVEDSRCITERS